MFGRGVNQNLGPRRANPFIFVLFLAFGIYFINFPFNFLGIPDSEIITKIQPWVIFAGGVLLIIGAVNYLRMKR